MKEKQAEQVKKVLLSRDYEEVDIVRYKQSENYSVHASTTKGGRKRHLTSYRSIFQSILDQDLANYPRMDRGKPCWVKHPVKQADGLWYGADVKEDGYTVSELSNGFEKESECQKACDSHNSYHGYGLSADSIISASMSGKLKIK